MKFFRNLKNKHNTSIMSRKCSITTCSNTYNKTKNVCVIDEKTFKFTTITYHAFPKDPHLRAKWIKATGRINWEPGNRCVYICSDHFKESDFQFESKPRQLGQDKDEPMHIRRLLKRNVIPTQQLGSIILAGDSEVYLKEENYSSLEEESTDISQSSDRQDEVNANGDNAYSTPLLSVKTEPDLEDYQLTTLPPFESTLTIKEENHDGEMNNGIFDPVSEESKFHMIISKIKSEFDPDHTSPKRIDQEVVTITENGKNVEKPTISLESTENMEEKYKRLLDQHLLLKSDYDMLKLKYEAQRKTLNECERLLRQCR